MLHHMIITLRPWACNTLFTDAKGKELFLVHLMTYKIQSEKLNF